MISQIVFDASGLKTFALIVLSCYPVHHELNRDAMDYLNKVIRGQEELNCYRLLEKLPALKEALLEFAKKGSHEKITAEVVAEFFASKDHYQKIIHEFEEKKLHIVPKSIFSLRTMFAHLVTPIEILAEEEEGFIGKYVSGRFGFEVKGLVASKSDTAKIQSILSSGSGVTVFAHFATIIDVAPPSDFVVQVFEMLNQSEFFVSACKYLQTHDGANYNIFPRNCRAKTQTVLEQIDL